MDWNGLGARDRSGRVNAIVETPAGSRSKFKYSEETGLITLSKYLPLGMCFPFDFGFIPGTRAGDGDPMDVLIVAEESAFAGCLVTVRILGVVEARQSKRGARSVRNDRLIATPETSKIRPEARSLADLPARAMTQIEQFFITYNRAEGRTFTVTGRRGPRAAHRLLDEAERRHRELRQAERTKLHHARS